MSSFFPGFRISFGEMTKAMRTYLLFTCIFLFTGILQAQEQGTTPGIPAGEIMKNYHKQMTICFYLQDGVEVLDFAGPMEVFSYAGFRVFTVSRRKEPIKTQGILTIMPDYGIDDTPPADILAFFGGNAGTASGDPAVISWIKSRMPATQYFFSVCTGAFIMGKAGILDSLSATTFHSSIESLRTALPKTRVLANVRFVDNGHVITTAGISAGIDGALHLVSRLKGEEVAKEVAAYMEYDKWIPNQGLIVGREPNK